MRRVALSALLAIVFPLCAATQDIGTLTVTEGGLRLIRGLMVMQVVEGIRLRQGDILESSDRGFYQLEFADSTIVALGPSSQVLLLRYTSGHVGSPETPAADIVLLKGWLKGENSAKSAAFRYSSPLLGAATQDGAINMNSQADTASLFVETGSALIGEVSEQAAWKRVAAAKSGQFFSRSAGGSVNTSGRPAPSFVISMPQSFRDTLPPRISRFAGKSIQPVRQRAVTFSDILPWLSMGRPWRMSLVRRFEGLAASPAFRAAMEPHLKEFPEWQPVLHPRKNSSDNSNSSSRSENQ